MYNTRDNLSSILFSGSWIYSIFYGMEWIGRYIHFFMESDTALKGLNSSNFILLFKVP